MVMGARRTKSPASGEAAIRFDWRKNTFLIWFASFGERFELCQLPEGCNGNAQRVSLPSEM